MASVQIIIATYNRPGHILNAVRSVLGQSFKNFELLISDNSTNNETETLLVGSQDERLTYKRRTPSLPALEHLNTIFAEATGDHFMIFHDDDVMHTNMLEELLNATKKYNGVMAIGTNAFYNKNGKNTGRLFLNRKNNDLVLKNSSDLIYQYLIKDIVPFPSYLYSGALVKKNIRFEPAHGGKYCDVALLMDIADAGGIVFLAKPLMDYYIHEEQDTMHPAFEQKIKLLNYILKKTTFKRNDLLIKRFRAENLYFDLKIKIINNIPVSRCRYFRIVGLLLNISLGNHFPKIIFVSFFHINSLLKPWINRHN